MSMETMMAERVWVRGEIVGYEPRAAAPGPVGGFGWYIAYVGGLTGPVVARLKRQGWESYVPMAVRFKPAKAGRGCAGRAKKARGRLRADRTQGTLRRIEEPVYPGYVFVAAQSRAPEAWDIAHVEGVAYLVHMADGDVVRLPNGIIEEVRDRAARSEAIREERGKLLIPDVGAAVRVIDGPFAGFNGIVESAIDGRVKIGVEIFGGSTPVELDLDQIAIL